jgi:hypothetical protein
MKVKDMEKILNKEENKKMAEKTKVETLIKATIYGIRF